MFISSAYAQTAPAAASGAAGGLMQTVLPFVFMFAVLYFVVIRPQAKRQKEHKALMDALAKGDEVVIAGGILGRIAKLSESQVHVEVANGVELQVQRASVLQVLPKGSYK